MRTVPVSAVSASAGLGDGRGLGQALIAPAARRAPPPEPECAPDAVALLRAADTRVTAGRVAIIGALLSAGGPMSAGQLLEALGDAAPDRVTVYRTVNALAEIGVIQEVLSFDRVRRFSIGPESEAVMVRFRCIRCGGSMTRPAVLPDSLGFEGCLVTRQALEIEGLCSECR